MVQLLAERVVRLLRGSQSALGEKSRNIQNANLVFSCNYFAIHISGKVRGWKKLGPNWLRGMICIVLFREIRKVCGQMSWPLRLGKIQETTHEPRTTGCEQCACARKICPADPPAEPHNKSWCHRGLRALEVCAPSAPAHSVWCVAEGASASTSARHQVSHIYPLTALWASCMLRCCNDRRSSMPPNSG